MRARTPGQSSPPRAVAHQKRADLFRRPAAWASASRPRRGRLRRASRGSGSGSSHGTSEKKSPEGSSSCLRESPFREGSGAGIGTAEQEAHHGSHVSVALHDGFLERHTPREPHHYERAARVTLRGTGDLAHCQQLVREARRWRGRSPRRDGSASPPRSRSTPRRRPHLTPHSAQKSPQPFGATRSQVARIASKNGAVTATVRCCDASRETQRCASPGASSSWVGAGRNGWARTGRNWRRLIIR